MTQRKEKTGCPPLDCSLRIMVKGVTRLPAELLPSLVSAPRVHFPGVFINDPLLGPAPNSSRSPSLRSSLN